MENFRRARLKTPTLSPSHFEISRRQGVAKNFSIIFTAFKPILKIQDGPDYQ